MVSRKTIRVRHERQNATWEAMAHLAQGLAQGIVKAGGAQALHHAPHPLLLGIPLQRPLDRLLACGAQQRACCPVCGIEEVEANEREQRYGKVSSF